MPESNLDRWSREVVEHSKGSIGLGLGLTFIFHFVFQVPTFFILLSTVTGGRTFEWVTFPLRYVGLSQLFYMIPAVLIARRKGEAATLKGLIIGASITFLLNCACTGLAFLNP